MNMVQFINITASIVTVATIIFIIQILFKWRNAPSFIIGIIPLTKERKSEGIERIGETSYFDEFRFDRRFLARKVNTEDELDSLRNYNDSSRSVYPDKNGNVKLPVIIQNTGKSEAGKYKLLVTFTNPDIRISDVGTETLEIDGLYTHDNSFIKNNFLLEKLPRKEFQDIYKDLDLTRDYLSLTGSLASRTFEAIFIELHIPNDCEDFFAIFKIDCPDFFFYSRQVYSQYVNVFKGKDQA